MSNPGDTVHRSKTQILIDTIAGQIVRKENEPWPWKVMQTDRDWEAVVRTVCDEGLAPPVEDDVASLRAKCDLDGVSDLVDASEECLPRVFPEHDLLA